IALCSLSTGTIVAPDFFARSRTMGPATTIDSLLARPSVLPLSAASITGPRQAAPLMPHRTTSDSSPAAMERTPSIPLRRTVDEPLSSFFRASYSAGSASAARAGLNRSICSLKTRRFDPAASPVTGRPRWAATSRPLTPIEPVDPRTATLLIMLVNPYRRSQQDFVSVLGLFLPLERHLPQVLRLEDVLHLVVRPFADDDGIDLGRLRQAGGDVDRVAEDRVLDVGRGADVARDDRAGVDRAAHLEFLLRMGLVELLELAEERRAGADRLGRVVLHVERRVEDRHHLVADEVVHVAVVLEDRIRRHLEELVEQG